MVPGVVAYSGGEGWVFPSEGLVQIRSRPGASFKVLSASGTALVGLRQAQVYGEFLHSFASGPHRVTRLDVALDMAVHAPPLIRSLYERACQGDILLTRKRLRPDRHISLHLGPNADGEDTGTLDLGGRTSEVKATLYDKRQERIVKGFDDPGPWFRVELTVTAAVGVSIRDAWAPEPVFWHFMGSALAGVVERPTGLPAWVPGDSGFKLPPRSVVDPVQRLSRRLERSRELLDLCELATTVRGGSVLFYRRLRKLGMLPPHASGSVFVPDFLLPASNDGLFAMGL